MLGGLLLGARSHKGLSQKQRTQQLRRLRLFSQGHGEVLAPGRLVARRSAPAAAAEGRRATCHHGYASPPLLVFVSDSGRLRPHSRAESYCGQHPSVQRDALLGRIRLRILFSDGVGGGATSTVGRYDVAAASAALLVVVLGPLRLSRYVVCRETAGGEYFCALLLAGPVKA